MAHTILSTQLDAARTVKHWQEAVECLITEARSAAHSEVSGMREEFHERSVQYGTQEEAATHARDAQARSAHAISTRVMLSVSHVKW